MKLRIFALVCSVLLVSAARLPAQEAPAAPSEATTAASQPTSKEAASPMPAKVTGEIGLTLEAVSGDTKSSKFEEYRTVPNGLYLQSLGLFADGRAGRQRFALEATKLTLRDARVRLQAEDFGLWSAELLYDRIPHVYSNAGRSIFKEEHGGVFILPNQMQQDLQAIATTDIDPVTPGIQVDAVAFGNIINALARPVSLRVQRNTIGLRTNYTPSANLAFYAEASDERRTGHRPLSATFFFTNQVELPAPIDYETVNVAVGGEYLVRRGVLQLQFNHSSFEDRNKSIVWSNPIRASDQTPVATAEGLSSNPEFGRLSTPPDNTADEITLNGVYRFSDTARFTGSLARGRWRQDERFLPMTINAALIAADPGAVVLPADSPDAKIDISLEKFAFHFDPAQSLQVTARYRRYEHDNDTRVLEFPGFVVTDSLLVAEPEENEPRSFTQKTPGLDLVWRPTERLNFRLAGEQDTWNRANRDVRETRENIIRASADYRANDWLLVRLGVNHGRRRIRGGYDTDEELEGLRRFDEANRNRTDATVLLQFTPGERFDGAIVLRNLKDDYPDSAFGVRRENMRDISLDWSYDISDRTGLYGGAGWNSSGLDLNSRVRFSPVTDPLDNWSSRERDTSSSVWLGISHVLRPKQLTFDFQLSYNMDRGRTTATFIPGGNPFGEATSWPEVKYTYLAPELELNYIASADRVWRFTYRFERYTERDFQWDIMQPAMGNVDILPPTSVFLGARVPGYRAHILSLELQQRF